MNEQQLLHAILREDFTAFVRKAFETVAPGERYVHNWHIEAIAHELTNCAAGKTRRLLITQPPRSLKSICASVAYPAWLLGRNPTLDVICVSYSQVLTEDLTRQFRMVVNSAWYQKTFPAMRVNKDTGGETITTKGGKRIATTTTGTLTGRGADVVIIDDPIKAHEASSETTRRSVNTWYSESLTTRLNDKNKGVIVIVMQRLHEDDLAGHVVSSGLWRHLDLPAIAIEDEKVEIGPGRFFERKAGEALHGEREGLATLVGVKADLGSLAFSAQYQQRPTPAEGNIVKRDWFGTYESVPDDRGVTIVQSWDLASSTKQTADYSACITAALYRKKIYLLDAWRGRLSFPDLRKRIIDHALHYRAETVLIEKASSGEQMLQDLQLDDTSGFPTPIGIRPESDKQTRMTGASPMIERGDVCLPKDAPWLGEFLGEVLGFPHGKHDDQVDAFSQLLNWARDRERFSEPAIAGGIVFTSGPDGGVIASGNLLQK